MEIIEKNHSELKARSEIRNKSEQHQEINSREMAASRDDSLASNERQKTALRIKYEAEASIIKKKIGDLEGIRKQLGLSQRKMCQLLMVDPSAWSRWTKGGGQVPPHIYRALQWYFALIEKSPEWHPLNTYLGAFRPPTSKAENKAEHLEENFQHLERQFRNTLHHNQQFMNEVMKQAQIHWGWKVLLVFNLVAILVSWLF